METEENNNNNNKSPKKTKKNKKPKTLGCHIWSLKDEPLLMCNIGEISFTKIQQQKNPIFITLISFISLQNLEILPCSLTVAWSD